MSHNSDLPEKEELLVEGLKFSGAITASVTHELNNVLGTIEQISGLLEDLAYTLEEKDSELSNQLNDIAGRIVRQTDRGSALIKQLNTFAHSSDAVSAEINVEDVLKNLDALMARMAKMNKVALEMTTPDDVIIISGYPYRFRQIVFGIIRRILPAVNRESTIQIETIKDNNQLVLSVRGHHNNAMTDLPSLAPLERLCRDFNGLIEERIDSSEYNCSLIIPIGGSNC
ncbi:MAG: hypothetical protein R3F48_12440 [Candidatus Zixiibacteriota bacterium]